MSNTYIFEHFRYEISVDIEAESLEEAKSILAKHVADGGFTHNTDYHATFHVNFGFPDVNAWEYVDCDVEKDHKDMSIAELVEHLCNDPKHQEDMWGHLR